MNTGRERNAVAEGRAFKVTSLVVGTLFAMVAKRLLRSLYRAVRHRDPDEVFDPTSERFSWPNAALWAAAAGVGLAMAKIVGDRVLAIGWRAVTGAPRPAAP